VGKRRKGREIVLQAAYAARISGNPPLDCLADQLARRQPADESTAFARDLFTKLVAHQDAAEVWLARLLENWQPERVGVVERIILLMALTELRCSPEVPWRVVINEACELARRFGDEAAVAFVNGILDRAANEMRPPSDPEESAG
jgi:N utilization substance protein B